jgi:hypothetical protein
LAFETRFGFFVNSRVKNYAALENLLSRFAREMPLDLAPRANDCELLVENEGVEERWLISDVEALDRDTAIATFLKHLPIPFAALRLVQFDPSDADHYLVVERFRADALLRVLGPEAALIFKVPPSRS